MSGEQLVITSASIPDGTIAVADFAAAAVPPYTHSYVQNVLGFTTTETFSMGNPNTSIGFIPKRACTVVSLQITGSFAAAQISTSPIVLTATLRKNSGVGGTAMIVATQTLSSTAAQGVDFASSTILSSASMNGTTDYLTLTYQCDTGTATMSIAHVEVLMQLA